MTDVNIGLTKEQVEELKKQGLENTFIKKGSKSVGQIIFDNLFTYFNFIFLVFTILLCMVKSYINLTFLPVIIWNILIGIIQEIRSKRVLDKLTVVSAPKSIVVRDGVKQQINSEELVKGDIVVLSSGNQIVADGLVVEGEVRVNEALITGEADEIKKENSDILLSGSFVVSGTCKAELTNVGAASYASKLTIEAKASRKRQQTEMMRSLDKLVKIIGFAIIPIGIALFCQSYFYVGESVKNSVVSMVASLVGMIPEGLYLLASIALVVSVMRLAMQKVLIHEMACVETLARVNVLCVDKTGTITENRMKVNKIIVSPNSSENEGDIYHRICNVVYAMNADNDTMIALKEYFETVGRNPLVDNLDLALETYSFSSENKYSGARFENGSYIIGAPEFVLLNKCDEYMKGIEDQIEDGVRVLAFGFTKDLISGKPIDRSIEPLAFICINNPIRETAKETFSYFQEQGVNIKVISGDNPKTTSSIAIKAGIKNADKYIDATLLKTDDEVLEAVKEYTVFGRVVPKQKQRIVQAIKDAGNVVAMTGDGVNDILALKTADCSVAMASGSDAACNAAQIVLLDSDFSKMPSVVLEGRRVVNNIQRSASLFLVKNIFSLLLTIAVLIIAIDYPLYPTQLSLLGAFTIGFPAFLLALQPNKSLIKGHFLTNVIVKALPAGITDILMVLTIVWYGVLQGLAKEQMSTMIILTMLSVGVVSLIRICMPFDKIRVGICVINTVGIIFSLIFLRPVFAIHPLDSTLLVITIVDMIVAIPAFIVVSLAVNALVELIAGKSKRFKKAYKG